MSRHLSPTKRCICLVRLILLIVERSVQSDDVGVGINSRIFWMENEQNLVNNSFHYKLYRPQVICSAVIFQHAIWIFHCFQISTWPTCAEILWSTAFKEMHFILEYPGALAAVIWVYRLFYLAFHTSGNYLDRKKNSLTNVGASLWQKHWIGDFFLSTKCLFQGSFVRLCRLLTILRSKIGDVIKTDFVNFIKK